MGHEPSEDRAHVKVMAQENVISLPRLIAAQRRKQEEVSRDKSTARLVVAAQAGSRNAFDALVRDLGPLLYRFLVVRLRNEADARDALQETLIVAWQKLPSVRDPQSCRCWLLTIALRKAAEVTKTERRHANVPAYPVATPDSAGAVELDAILQSLSGERRDVVLLRYLIGLSEAETANVLGVSVGTVKSRASRARQEIARFNEAEAGGDLQ
jgi:RNA polymerase sigma-70 factor, ECF subfamily